jgi:LPXTG-motif cell wall-anchored protein
MSEAKLPYRKDSACSGVYVGLMPRVVMFAYVLLAGLATPALLYAADGGQATPTPSVTGAPAADPGSATPPADTTATTPAPAPAPAPAATPAAPAAQAVPAAAAPPTRAHPGRTSVLGARQPVKVRAVARAAGADTISDFKYAPSSITVTAGDSVTWTNDGPAGHSATADDGSFDTGVLGRGTSGSHRFTKAGTYAFHCTPHPFMKGTVVVVAASSGGGSGASGSASGSGSSSGASADTGTSSSGSGSATTGSSSSSGSSLPNTGADLGAVALLGAILLGGGMVLRRRVAGNR